MCLKMPVASIRCYTFFQRVSVHNADKVSSDSGISVSMVVRVSCSGRWRRQSACLCKKRKRRTADNEPRKAWERENLEIWLVFPQVKQTRLFLKMPNEESCE